MTWAPDYTTASRLKDYLRITDNADDVLIGLWITTASRNVDDHCGRQFGQVDAPELRYYTPFWDRHERAWYAEIDDVQDVTGLTVADENGTAVDAASYQLLPRNGAQRGKPFTQLRLTTCTTEVAVTATWGWTAVPSSVEVGLLLQAARLNARRKSPFGIAGSPSDGSEIRLLAQLDPDFRTSLKPYVRKWWAA